MPNYDAELAAFRHPWGPFDYLALGDRERIHSEALRWLFLKNSPYSAHRAELAARFLGTEAGAFSVVDARSELVTSRRRLDVWLELSDNGKRGIAVENKLIAIESPRQTHDTRSELLEAGRDVAMFVFLSLQRTRAVCGAWRSVGYADLLATVERALALSVEDGGFLSLYSDALRRLVAAVELVTTRPAEIGMLIFGARGTPKDGPWKDFIDYVEEMNLRRTLQSVWLQNLAAQIEVPEGWSSWRVAESRGEALLQTERLVTWQGHRLRVGFQLQHDNPKAFVAPEDYRKGARKGTAVAAGELAAVMKSDLGLPRLSTSRGLGFRSGRAFAPPSSREPSEWTLRIASVLNSLDRWLPQGLAPRPTCPACDCAHS